MKRNNRVSRSLSITSETRQTCAQRLKAVHLKCTKGRLDVLLLLATADHPMSVEQIMSELGTSSPDRATIYRIVAQFVGVGLAKEVYVRDGIARYEFQDTASPECHHAICTRCGQVSHIESEKIDTFIATMKKDIRSLALVSGYTLDFFGVCTACVAR
jgi:Fe2+ or Zn2+ uptake regulation protein